MSRETLTVIKIGGNIVDDEQKLRTFLADLASLPGVKILVHGGGKLATRLAEQLQLPQQLIEGRRITDAETLKIVTMVYAGLINKNIVAQLQSEGCNAIGITGADGNAVLAHKRVHSTIDYGFAGDVDSVNASFFISLFKQNLLPVVAPITHDGKGQLLNTNADTMAQEIARSLGSHYEVQLVYSFEKAGVLLDASDEASVIPRIDPNYYRQLKEEQKVFAGMIPKLDNAFAALDSGVTRVIIGKAEELHQIVNGEKGTVLVHG
jgi:acetylglutamate kinase